MRHGRECVCVDQLKPPSFALILACPAPIADHAQPEKFSKINNKARVCHVCVSMRLCPLGTKMPKAKWRSHRVSHDVTFHV